MSKKILSLAIILVVGSFFLISCSSKEPADVAIKAAETAVNATKAEAARIVPDQVKALDVSLAAAKEKFAKGDYKAALEEVTALTGKVNDVLAAAKAKKEEMTKKWMDLDLGLINLRAGDNYITFISGGHGAIAIDCFIIEPITSRD